MLEITNTPSQNSQPRSQSTRMCAKEADYRMYSSTHSSFSAPVPRTCYLPHHIAIRAVLTNRHSFQTYRVPHLVIHSNRFVLQYLDEVTTSSCSYLYKQTQLRNIKSSTETRIVPRNLLRAPYEVDLVIIPKTYLLSISINKFARYLRAPALSLRPPTQGN